MTYRGRSRRVRTGGVLGPVRRGAGRRVLRSLESATGVVIEALEARRMLSVTVEGGVMIARGTAGDDAIVLEWVNERGVYWRINGETVLRSLDGVTGIRIFGGNGHDKLGVAPMGWLMPDDQWELFVPMTVSGGAGEDTIWGADGRDELRGGSGEDEIYGAPVRDDEVPLTEQVVGGDTLFGDVSEDVFAPEAGDGDFVGAPAEIPSARVHDGVLWMSGTSGADQFVLRYEQDWFQDRLTAMLAFKIEWYGFGGGSVPVSAVTEIRIVGRGGADEIVVIDGGPPTRPVTLHANGTTQAVPGSGRWVVDGAGVLRVDQRRGYSWLDADGTLNVEGTAAGDYMSVSSWGEQGRIIARCNDWVVGYDRAAVRRVRIVGGDGNDTISYSTELPQFGLTAIDVPTMIDGGAGDDAISGSGGAGNRYGVMLIGGAGVDNLWSWAGASTLRGGTGNDSLRGGDGPCEMYGGAGDDTLFRWAGDPVMDGGAGYDARYTRRADSGEWILMDREVPVEDDGGNEPVDGGADGAPDTLGGEDGPAEGDGGVTWPVTVGGGWQALAAVESVSGGSMFARGAAVAVWSAEGEGEAVWAGGGAAWW